MPKLGNTLKTIYKEINSLAKAFFWTRSVKIHPNAKSNLKGDYFLATKILKCIEKSKKEIKIENIFEVGSNFADGAELLRKIFNLKRYNVHVFEAHPLIFPEIEKLYPGFNINNFAVFNIDKVLKFNLSAKDCGHSSILTKNSDYINTSYEKTAEVKSIRLDRYLDEKNIKNIDLLKIDAEGCGYEVLDGLGKYLREVTFIYIELEDYEYWNEQKTFQDSLDLLKNTHSIVFLDRVDYLRGQTDSLWIKTSLLNDLKK